MYRYTANNETYQGIMISLPNNQYILRKPIILGKPYYIELLKSKYYK